MRLDGISEALLSVNQHTASLQILSFPPRLGKHPVGKAGLAATGFIERPAFLVIAAEQEESGVIDFGLNLLWIQGKGLAVSSGGFFKLAEFRERDGQVVVSIRIVEA